MSDDAKIDELLDCWEELREQGMSISPEELCRDCPELLGAVKEQVFALQWVPSPDAAAHPDQASFTTRSINGQQTCQEPVPKTLGRYELKQPIGAGGFGQVWLAYDPELRRDVAIKIPRRDRAPSPGETDHFLEEARKVAQLRHPNIVPVHDVGREEARRYIVSEWIDGTDLAERIRLGHISFPESARIVADVAEALHHAHLRNIVHRDIKPSNILLDKQAKPYVADFGIAVTEEELLAEDNVVSGTLAYMSPEQVSGESQRVNARSDVYCLGVVLYELLTRRLPFKAATLDGLRKQILSGEPRPPRTIDDSIPAELEAICLKAMSKDPADRYSTAKDMASCVTWVGTMARDATNRFKDVHELLAAAAEATEVESKASGRKLWGLWSPTVILVITLVLGILASLWGILFAGTCTAMNWLHLGEPRRAWQPLLITIGGGSAWLILDGLLGGAFPCVYLKVAACWLATGLLVYLDIWPQRKAATKHLLAQGRLAQPWIPLGITAALLVMATVECVTNYQELIAEVAAERGLAHLNKGEFAEAEAAFYYATQHDPEEPWYYFCLAEALYYGGASDLALQDYSSHIRLGGREPMAYVNRANIFSKKGDYDLAIADCNDAIRVDPSDPKAFTVRGAAYYKKDDFSRAIADYSQAIRLNPDLAEAYFNRGVAYKEMGDLDKAIVDYSQAIRLNPDLAEAYFNRGIAHGEKGDPDKTIADYNQAIRLNTDYVEAYSNRGIAHGEKGDRDKAIVDYSQAIRLNPDRAEAYYNRGMAYEEEGDRDKAIADFSQVIRLDPDDAEAYFKRGIAYQEKGDEDKAIVDYSQAIRLNPDLEDAYFNRGIAYQEKGDLNKAFADFSQAIRLNPDGAMAYLNRGIGFEEEGDLDRAIADFSQVIRLNPDLAEAYFHRGVAYGEKGNFDKAIADFSQAIRLNPDGAMAYVNRGIAYKEKGDLDKAFADFSQAIRLNPDLAEAYCSRGSAYKEKGDLDKAIVDYSRAIRLNPDLAEAYFSRGIAHGEKGDFDEAIVDYSQVIRLNPDDAEAYYNRGVIYRAKGDEDKAVANFNRAKELDPNIGE